MLDCVDVASFHTYDRAARMQELVGKYRDWLAAHGRPDMPLWITESGRPWKKGPSRPPADQDAASALDITRKAIEVRACGVARYFAFVYPFYEENENNFGMLDRWGTPLRSFAAYAQAARALGGKQYLGDLRLGESAPAARVFGDQRETVAVLTAAAGTTADRRCGRSAGAASRGTGRPQHPSQRGGQGSAGGRLGVRLARSGVGGEAIGHANRGHAFVARIGPRQPPPPRESPSPIVLRWQIDPAAFKPETAGYRVVGETPGKSRLAVRAFNLSEQPAEFRLALDAGDAPVRISGENPCAVRVPAAGFADAVWEVDLSDAFARSDQISVTVRPTGDVPERTLPLAVTLIGQPTIAQRLARYAQHGSAAAGRSGALDGRTFRPTAGSI